MEPSEVLTVGKQQRRVQARSFFFFWAVRELGSSLREFARRVEMSPAGVRRQQDCPPHITECIYYLKAPPF
jgi:hypothetical protein